MSVYKHNIIMPSHVAGASFELYFSDFYEKETTSYNKNNNNNNNNNATKKVYKRKYRERCKRQRR